MNINEQMIVMEKMKGKFIKIPKNFYQYEELRSLDGTRVHYYCWLVDLLQLSKGDSEYQKDGVPFVRFTEDMALLFCNIKPGKLKAVKRELKELGLIDYKEQKVKKLGVASEIYVTEFICGKRREEVNRTNLLKA